MLKWWRVVASCSSAAFRRSRMLRWYEVQLYICNLHCYFQMARTCTSAAANARSVSRILLPGARRWQSQSAAHSVKLEQGEVQTFADRSVCVENVPDKGRSLIYRGAGTLPAGQIVLNEAPLVAVSDPLSTENVCQRCFLHIKHRPVRCECGASYCSEQCKHEHWSIGHEALCGGTSDLDAFCKEQRINFPRVAAAMLARSLSADQDFVRYWERVNRLAHVSTGLAADAEEDEFPSGWRQGHRLVRAAISPRMGGDKDAFFGRVFNIRFYARLMGILRLNTFSFPCPLDGQPSVAGPGQASASPSPAAPPPLPTTDTAGGCCSSDPSTGDAGCGSEASSCGGSAARAGEAPGGTVLFALGSFANHSCDPSLDVLLGPGVGLSLRTRRPVQPGEELTVTYIDSSLPVELRRAKLGLYGFTCACSLCTQQLTEQKGHKRA